MLVNQFNSVQPIVRFLEAEEVFWKIEKAGTRTLLVIYAPIEGTNGSLQATLPLGTHPDVTEVLWAEAMRLARADNGIELTTAPNAVFRVT